MGRDEKLKSRRGAPSQRENKSTGGQGGKRKRRKKEKREGASIL